MQSIKEWADQALNRKWDLIEGEAPDPTPIHPQRVTLDQLDESVHPKMKKVVAAARRWASEKVAGNDRISLVLVATAQPSPNGKPDHNRTGFGCGKTHIAKAIQWSSYTALDDGTPVAPTGRFYTARDLMELIGDGNTVQELIPQPTELSDGSRVGGTPVVVIDDVGREGTLRYVSAGAQQNELRARYFMLVNYCYEKRISIVLTANMTIDQLAQHLGGSTWSRLQQMAPKGMILDLTGVPDYRRKQGGRK